MYYGNMRYVMLSNISIEHSAMCIDEWMTCDFTFFQTVFLSNSISVISGGWAGDTERLSAKEIRLRLKKCPPGGLG